MKVVPPFSAFLLLTCSLFLCPLSQLLAQSADDPQLQREAPVMWALTGVLPRDRAHWIRNFDYYQLIPGIAPLPVDLVPENPESRFQPDELKQISERCDAVGCRFFFVVEVGRLQESLQADKEGSRRNFHQDFRQQLLITAYSKAPGKEQWEKISLAQQDAVLRDMIGSSKLEAEERKRIADIQRCEFLREEPAKTAAGMLGQLLVKVECKFAPGKAGEKPQLAYRLTNQSPLPLSSIYISLPVQPPNQPVREEILLFGDSIKAVGTLEPYGVQTAKSQLDLRAGWKPQPLNAKAIVKGWTQQELDEHKSVRRGQRDKRLNWLEHPDLPPDAKDIDWEAEENTEPSQKH